VIFISFTFFVVLGIKPGNLCMLNQALYTWATYSPHCVISMHAFNVVFKLVNINCTKGYMMVFHTCIYYTSIRLMPLWEVSYIVFIGLPCAIFIHRHNVFWHCFPFIMLFLSPLFPSPLKYFLYMCEYETLKPSKSF
jgi:hypothetical protein